MRFSRQGDSLYVLAPAKLNLRLDVLGRRQDGYHDLQTVMVSVQLYDSLQFQLGETGELSLACHDQTEANSELPVDDRNLVLRAAKLLQTETGCPLGAQITLEKRIPSQAGMGGGSSDAAATLQGLNRLWQLHLPAERLHELAAKLGSDVNFFLDSPVAAICTGRGERVEPVRLKRLFPLVVIKPPVGLSTGRVFSEWAACPKTRKTSFSEAVQSLSSGETRNLSQLLINDLEAPARKLNDQIERLLSRLTAMEVVACGMTGSGSACYAVCRTWRQARFLAGQCRSWNLGQVYALTTGA